MAFKEVYEKNLSDARANGRPVKWSPSLGYNRSERKVAVLNAVEKNRITMDHAVMMLPELEDDAPVNPRIAAVLRKAISDDSHRM